MDDVTEKLWEAFVSFVRKNNLTLKQPGLIIDTKGKYKNTNLHSCFIGAKTSEFRTEKYTKMFRFFDELGGFFHHRWDEQKLFAFYVAIYLSPSEVEYFDYVSIEHQKGETSASKLPDEDISIDLIESLFTH